MVAGKATQRNLNTKLIPLNLKLQRHCGFAYLIIRRRRFLTSPYLKFLSRIATACARIRVYVCFVYSSYVVFGRLACSHSQSLSAGIITMIC